MLTAESRREGGETLDRVDQSGPGAERWAQRDRLSRMSEAMLCTNDILGFGAALGVVMVDACSLTHALTP